MKTEPRALRAAAMTEKAGDAKSAKSMLNSDDVCDRCGARAYMVALFEGGRVLTFCGYRGTALDAAALFVYDETYRLTRQADVALG